MTAQRSDTVLYLGRDFILAGARGQGLFAPHEHGIEPDSSWTDCRSGFYCVYEVEADAFLLKDAYVMLKGAHPLLFGKKPVHVPRDYVYVYRGLHAPVGFSGKLLLAGGFIERLGGFAGSSPLWKYEALYELRIEAGRVLGVEDRSAQMAQAREVMTGGLGPMTLEERREMEAWLARDFGLDYGHW